MQQPPTQGTGGATDELRSDAQQLTSKAASRIHSEVDARKGNAAEQAKSVSNAIEAAAGVPTGQDRWQVIGRELHLRYAAGAGRADLKEAQLARALGRIPATARNLNTVRKLIELAGS